MLGRLQGLSKQDARARGRAARGVRARGRRRPQGLDVLRRHAPAPRHRRQPDPQAEPALPRLAHATGLDPRGRIEVWETVRQVVTEGTTVLLTTQYLDEADRLADRITVLGWGRTIAEGTASELKDRLGGDRVIVTAAGADLDQVARVLDYPRTPDPPGGRGGRPGRRYGGAAVRRTRPRRRRPRGRRRAAAPTDARRGLPAPDRRDAPMNALQQAGR